MKAEKNKVRRRIQEAKEIVRLEFPSATGTNFRIATLAVLKVLQDEYNHGGR